MKIYSSSNQDLKLAQIGGKGFNLYRLKHLGMHVPDWVVLDQSSLENSLPTELKQTRDAEKIIHFLDTVQMPDTILESVAKHIDGAKEKLFAVRSSALLEDGKQQSFAGQFESHLYVSFADIPHFVKQVWKSNFSDRVFTYLKTHNLEPNFGIGVVIQEMIDPEISGVAFGIDPSTGVAGSKVICSVYGVGEGIVSGELDADTYKLNGTSVTTSLALKTTAGRKSKSGKVQYDAVSEVDQKKSSLSNEQIETIRMILDKLEKALGGPQDIEFAIRNGTIYLTQTRPVTAVINETGKKQNNRIIWDNSNIIESYPGVTTPLTFSYISEAYHNVYEQLALIMGASKKSIRENNHTFSNMLGLIHGRVYYNLLSWYKVLALFPGYRLNAQFMENMMGVKERFELPVTRQTSWLSAFGRTLIMISKIIGSRIAIKRTTRQFMSDVNTEIDRIKQLKLEKLSAYELKELWIDLDRKLTAKWKAPLINDSFAMIYFGRLHKLVGKYKVNQNPNIQNDLLCGSKDIISVEPIHRSIAIATSISKNDACKKLFLEKDATTIWKELATFSDIKKQVDQYIEKFGERCVGELKLETVSYKQDPSLFIATLKSFVVQGITQMTTESGVDLKLRTAAEGEIREKLKFRPYRRWKLNSTLKKARYFVSNRENLRYERTRVFGITREVFSHIGKCFRQENVIAHERDIFYLTKEEIFNFIDGTSVTADLKSLIELRKKEYALFESEDAPAERFTTYESVNSGNNFYGEQEITNTSDTLQGLGCCPGIIRAKVRLVKHPKEVESLNGDILVTSSTDPGWVTLFPSASAILVERGSLLSHSAIVSREMGIPCVVGVTGLLKKLKTGDLVEMNGSTGTIQILKHGE